MSAVRPFFSYVPGSNVTGKPGLCEYRSNCDHASVQRCPRDANDFSDLCHAVNKHQEATNSLEFGWQCSNGSLHIAPEDDDPFKRTEARSRFGAIIVSSGFFDQGRVCEISIVLGGIQ
jgi:hypothetical protein